MFYALLTSPLALAVVRDLPPLRRSSLAGTPARRSGALTAPQADADRTRSRPTASTMIPGDNLLNPVRQPLLRAADLNDGHDRCAAERAGNRAFPPVRLPPPMMTAAITSSSSPTATVGSPTDSLENSITPATPASAAASE